MHAHEEESSPIYWPPQQKYQEEPSPIYWPPQQQYQEKPSPIYWPSQQQYQEEPPPLSKFDFQNKMLNLLSETNQIMKSQQEMMKSQQELVYYTPQFFIKIDAKISTYIEQIINILNREEKELQSQPVANPNRHYMEDESTSYHEQAITTLKSEKVVENHMEERKEEQIEATQDLH